MAIYGYTLTSSLSRIKGCGVVMMMVVVVLQQHEGGSEKYQGTIDDGDEIIRYKNTYKGYGPTRLYSYGRPHRVSDVA